MSADALRQGEMLSPLYPFVSRVGCIGLLGHIGQLIAACNAMRHFQWLHEKRVTLVAVSLHWGFNFTQDLVALTVGRC